jgi:endoglucanase
MAGMLVGCGGGGAGLPSASVPSSTFDSGPETTRTLPLGRGINLGNMLEAPMEGAWGFSVQQAFFPIIKGKGFDTVRIPANFAAHAASSEPYTVDPIFMSRVATVLDWAFQQNLNVMLDFHGYQELCDAPLAQEARFLALWAQIADRFKDAPDRLYLELLNEPNGNLNSELWNRILAKAVGVVRAVDARHTLVIGGTNWNSAYALKDLQLPPGESKVIATFHFYSPFTFTHQGAEWVTPILPTGISWPGPNVQGACKAITDELEVALAWSRANGNIPLFMGEFGAYSKGDLQSRANWTAYVRKQAEQRGCSWAYWEFCAGFGAYDTGTGYWNQALAGALGVP